MLSTRLCQNITTRRAEVGHDEVKKYFNNLEISLEGVPASHIINYDETNLTDDPGRKKCIFKRGVKYPDRVLNATKGAISLMYAGTAAGDLLPL